MRENSVPNLPQFATLIQTNDAPSPEERKLLLNSLSVPEMTLRSMRLEISQLTGRLKALVDEEKQLREKLAPYRAVLSPFRALPDDILREIFLACIPTNDNPPVDARHAPILLSHISRHARLIALTTSRLWAAIHVSIKHSQRGIGRQSEAVAEWIRRSGVCDLSLSVHEDLGSASSPPLNVDELFKILSASSTRWRKISFSGSFSSVQRLFSPVRDSLGYPRLESCSITVTSKPGRKHDPQAVFNGSALVTAPRLNDLNLLTSSPAGNYSAYTVRWDRLTHLSLGSSTSAAKLGCVGAILRLTTQLRSCTLHVKHYESLPPISLPHLTSMSLAIAPDEWWLNTPQARDLFAEMFVPSLRCITYDAANGIMPLFGLLHGAEGRIRHLSVANLSGPLQLIECLQFCPRLISLDVRALGQVLTPPENTALLGWFEYFQSTASRNTGGYLLHQFLLPGVDLAAWPPPPKQYCLLLEYLSVTHTDKSVNIHVAPFLEVKSQEPTSNYTDYGVLPTSDSGDE